MAQTPSDSQWKPFHVWVKILLSAPAAVESVCPDEGDYFGQNMRTVRRKMLTTSLKYNSRRPHEKPKKGLAGRFCSTEGCIFGVLALWLQKPLQWDFVSVRKKEKKNYTSQQVRLYTSPADILKHTWPLLSSQPPRWKESEWSCIPAESLASSDLSYCVNTGHTASERPAIEVNLHWKHSVLRDWFFLSWIILDRLIDRWVATILLVNLCQITLSQRRRKAAN